ncbi:hypothetical protein PAAG_11547 [Paracoccidioides lutzii Pb01]|uniref:Uncharacterized protein n=1 Tax=Paracoccidioides lutzii (strain ATCC MYA-826 / Pb01) TaxID=502779 RepID=A0A0A2V1R4_PARBA|nr:hypothetical protein PAAG_11547 [Paracoccidioides lutzii Pb01]KGQ01701.1 hypothetical protein PAAG_11547 [Paracoccidioides lutzii Pb01]
MAPVSNQVSTTGERVATDPTLHAIAKVVGHTLAQGCVLPGVYGEGYVVLPKSSNPGRIERNFQEI